MTWDRSLDARDGKVWNIRHCQQRADPASGVSVPPGIAQHYDPGPYLVATMRVREVTLRELD